MSGLQGLKVFISQRLTAAVDDILGQLDKTILEYEEETERRHRDVLDVVLTAEMKQDRAVLPAGIQQLSVKKEEATVVQLHDRGSTLDHKDPTSEFIDIKKEHEEEDVTKCSPILVKSEDEEEPQSSQLQIEENIIILEEEDNCEVVKSENGYKTSAFSASENVHSVESNAIQELPSRVADEIPLSNAGGNNNVNPFRCSECGKRFGTMSYLKLHIRCHTGERPYRCPVCRKSFSWKGRLQKHIRIHTGEKPFRCSVCGKMFSESGNLKVHMRTHTGEKPFSCTVCGKSYAQRGNLKIHMAVHKGETISSCSLHQSSQPQYSHAEGNRNSQRTPDSGKSSEPTGRLRTGNKLCRHETGNSGVTGNCSGCTASKKQFSCSECGKWFGFKGQLTAHMRCHTGEKPFRCPVCVKCFSWNGCLQKHMKIHTGEKPYRCTVCTKDFVESGNLKVHMRIHTGEKPFSCSTCGKRYRQKGSLTKHLEVHRAEKYSY